jgi:ABC-2 type transport system permease protein
VGSPFAAGQSLELATVRRLLRPRSLALRNVLVRSERRWLYVGFILLGFAFWLGLFAVVYYLVGLLWAEGPMAPWLAPTFLKILLISLSGLLSFSSTITALSVFYLSDDLELVLSLPTGRASFYTARFVDTLVQSSWMMLVFGLPVFLAGGFAAQAGRSYFLALFYVVPCLLVISSAAGVVLATALVNLFSARRARDALMFLAVAMVAALLIFLRSLRPEQLVDAQAFNDLASYLVAIRLDAFRHTPPGWGGDVLGDLLLNSPIRWLPMARLGAAAAASMAFARWATAWGFDTGWARSQEAKAARFHASRAFDRVVRVLPSAWRPIAAKELRILVRDPAQWSQLLLLAALCVIYLVSVGFLPVSVFRGTAGQWLREGLSFLNLGMAGFVMAAVAARFQFTGISREGRSWWILRGAPVDPVVILHAKAAFGLVPMVVVGQIVVVGSGVLLEARPALLVAESGLALLLAWAISGLASALGAIWPDFSAENAARAAASPAAVFFMVIAQVLVSVVLGCLVLAAYLGFRGQTLPATLFGALPVLLCLWVGYWPVRRAARVLWSRGLH